MQQHDVQTRAASHDKVETYTKFYGGGAKKMAHGRRCLAEMMNQCLVSVTHAMSDSQTSVSSARLSWRLPVAFLAQTLALPKILLSP